MRKTTGILDRVFGVDRLVRLAPPFHPAYFLGFLLLLLPNTSLAQSSVNSGASWSQYKSQCGIPASTAYNTWDGICPNSTASGNGSTPSVPALNPQQQLGMQLGMIGANMVGQAIGQGLHDWLFGSPDTPPVTAPPDPAEEQRQLAAQQLNNSGLYLLKQKNYAGAITEFQKALAIIPNDSNTLHNLTLAKQKMKDAAVAGQTSGALGQFLGNAPASTGLFGFAQPTDSPLASPNSSALSLVNLDSDTNVVDLRGTTKTYVDPESLKGQLDGILENHAVATSPPDSRVVLPQDKDIELLSTLSQPGASQSQVVLPQDKDEELLSTLSQSGPSQSQVVLPQDKDMELLGFPPPSGGSNPNNGNISASATAGNGANNTATNFMPASTPLQSTLDSDPSIKNALNDNRGPANKGTGTGFFGTSSSDPSSPGLLAPNLQPPPAANNGTDTNARRQGMATAASSISGQRASDGETAARHAENTFDVGGANQTTVTAAPMIYVATPRAEPVLPPVLARALAVNKDYQMLGTDLAKAARASAAAQQQLAVLDTKQKTETNPNQRQQNQLKIIEVSEQLATANSTIATDNTLRHDIERKTVINITIIPAGSGLDKGAPAPPPTGN